MNETINVDGILGDLWQSVQCQLPTEERLKGKSERVKLTRIVSSIDALESDLAKIRQKARELLDDIKQREESDTE